MEITNSKRARSLMSVLSALCQVLAFYETFLHVWDSNLSSIISRVPSAHITTNLVIDATRLVKVDNIMAN